MLKIALMLLAKICSFNFLITLFSKYSTEYLKEGITEEDKDKYLAGLLALCLLLPDKGLDKIESDSIVSALARISEELKAYNIEHPEQREEIKITPEDIMHKDLIDQANLLSRTHSHDCDNCPNAGSCDIEDSMREINEREKDDSPILAQEIEKAEA